MHTRFPSSNRPCGQVSGNTLRLTRAQGIEIQEMLLIVRARVTLRLPPHTQTQSQIQTNTHTHTHTHTHTSLHSLTHSLTHSLSLSLSLTHTHTILNPRDLANFQINEAEGNNLLDVAFPAYECAVIPVPFREGRGRRIGPRGTRNTLFLHIIPSVLKLALEVALVRSLPCCNLCGCL